MNCLYLVLFALFSQDCSQLGKCLLPQDTSFFTGYLFKRVDHSKSFSLGQVSHMKGFDFKQSKNSFYDYEGVVIYDDGDCHLLQRTTEPTNHKSLCLCDDISRNVCQHCTQFKQKLRNGIFYGGDDRVYRQDEAGNVLVDQYSSAGEKLTTRFLFKNLKKIIQVQMGEEGNVVFLTENTLHSDCVTYNYGGHKKSLNRIDYPELKEVYENKFPWTRQESKDEPSLKVLANNLVIGVNCKPLWLSLFKKTLFRKIIHTDGDKGLVFLQTDQQSIHAFNIAEQRFFDINIQTTPAYDKHDVSWLDTNVDIETIMQPIEQSWMGSTFGDYILRFKAWIVCLKDRLARFTER